MDVPVTLKLNVQGEERTASATLDLQVDQGDEASAAKVISAVVREAMFRLGFQVESDG